MYHGKQQQQNNLISFTYCLSRFPLKSSFFTDLCSVYIENKQPTSLSPSRFFLSFSLQKHTGSINLQKRKERFRTEKTKIKDNIFVWKLKWEPEQSAAWRFRRKSCMNYVTTTTSLYYCRYCLRMYVLLGILFFQSAGYPQRILKHPLPGALHLRSYI